MTFGAGINLVNTLFADDAYLELAAVDCLPYLKSLAEAVKIKSLRAVAMLLA
jgi:hypothetical protein